MKSTSAMPLMIEIQGIFDEESWNNLSRRDQAELIHAVVKGMELSRRPLYVTSRALGAPILDTSTATRFNKDSAAGRKSAQPWSIEDDTAYSDPGDAALARDIYCFQHFAEKIIGEVPAEAQVAAAVCTPDVRTPQLYNRDGMLGDRTQALLQNFAATNGQFIDKDKPIPQGSPLIELGDKLTSSLYWDGLVDAIEQGKALERSGAVAPPPPPAPAASDMGQEFIDLYASKGREDLIGANSSIFTPQLPGPPSTQVGPTQPPAPTAPIEKTAQKTGGSAELSGETDWVTIGLIAGGVAAVGAALYFTSPSKKKRPMNGVKLRLPHK